MELQKYAKEHEHNKYVLYNQVLQRFYQPNIIIQEAYSKTFHSSYKNIIIQDLLKIQIN
mgnify:CR=1 FL=1|uniref:Uncharacterized protein n=1 Tax=viral metagenome TaxID=1070528 RepID=A0A6C0JBE4_9ZZZZ